ncbi:hypothetical protein GCM10011320_50270 [Neoroseomonas lacus]|uniref:Uncharacterized protein n=1 Tax=Neoroseomonas lacus TaxID=287609 RepID=A0A917L0Q5_9PROT|nr:hypothetical protein GCM10011320_50270 [Neoroseomonas lacus]
MKLSGRCRVITYDAAEGHGPMSSNSLYFLVGALLAGVIGVGIWMYQDSQRSGVEISVGRNGVSIEGR